MNEKFKIYCDFQGPKEAAAAAAAAAAAVSTNQGQSNQQQIKREPLGLRQASDQQAAKAAASALTDEDQENDISMASLGSDFVPSIMHESDNYIDHSFSLASEESFTSCGQIDTSEPTNSELAQTNDDDDFIMDDTDMLDDADLQQEYDEELKKELSQAFKRHDDSQLFKAVTYIEDIDSYMKKLERISEFRPLPNYIDFQEDIDSNKRTILINWLIEVADEYQLQTETLFICTSIIDRFLSTMSITTSNLQLLGVAAMFIATKYEEIYPPTLYQFVEVTDDSYSGQQIRHMEQVILKALEFRISLPTPTFFLRQIFAYNKFPKKVYDLAEYLCYLSLLVDQPFLEYLPSEIALASVILAAYQLDVETIPVELRNAYDQSNFDQLSRRHLPEGVKSRDIDRRQYTLNKQLPFCIESLCSLQELAYNRSPKLPKDLAIAEIFAKQARNCVSLIQPMKGLATLSVYG